VKTAETSAVGVPPAQMPPVRSEHRSIGRRLLDAFAAFDCLPALESALEDVAEAQSSYRLGIDVIATIESDVALTVAVLRRANRGSGASAKVAGVPEALERIGTEGLEEIIASTPTFKLFDSAGIWGSAPRAHRIHALATQRAAGRIASELMYSRQDELFVAALLHDIGKLVLSHADWRYPELDAVTDLTPERRIALERRELGVDHAVVGGVLARRWGLPRELAHAIGHHHDPAETGLPGMVRLGDMIARFEAGNPVSGKRLQSAASNVGLTQDRLESLLASTAASDRRSNAPSPLTPSERRILAELGRGHVYKEIAHTLALSPSTVRTHIYNTYQKLGVSDRAQAVLLARENNWI
jgi:putative nucleotidyltransferase with HDIG domain